LSAESGTPTVRFPSPPACAFKHTSLSSPEVPLPFASDPLGEMLSLPPLYERKNPWLGVVRQPLFPLTTVGKAEEIPLPLVERHFIPLSERFASSHILLEQDCPFSLCQARGKS